MYEFFDHTADLGLRIRAADFPTLCAEAAQALFAAVVEDPNAVNPARRVEVHVAAEENEFLLFDWLKELLSLFESERLLFRRFAVEVSQDGLHGQAWGEEFDPVRHALAHEVKAITYHELKVEQSTDGWMAEVIVDI